MMRNKRIGIELLAVLKAFWINNWISAQGVD
jgi:hypothetical protein